MGGGGRLVLREIQVRGGVKTRPHPSGVWIFSGITQCLKLVSTTAQKLSSLYVYFNAIFSAECTIGMVRGLTPLKHYGAMALWHYGNKV